MKRSASRAIKATDAHGRSRSVPLDRAHALATAMLSRIGVVRIGRTTSLDVVGVETAGAARVGVSAPGVTVTSGKGRTGSEAELAAAMEALERYAAEPRGRIPVSHARLDEIPDAIDPGRLILASWSRYRHSNPIDWCEAASLVDGARRVVPANAVFFPYESSAEQQLFAAGTTGLAAGAAWTDAVVHGLLECIERDQYSLALARIESTGVGGPALSPSALGEALAAEVARIRGAGVDVHLRDVTRDLRVPTIVATLASDDRFHLGCASHPQAAVAAEAALFEAAQSRATDLQGAREDLEPDDGMPPHPWFFDQRLPTCEPPQGLVTEDVAEELRWLVARVREAGIEPMVLDLSVEDTGGLSCVRVLAPGLEQWAGDPDRVGARVRRWAQ